MTAVKTRASSSTGSLSSMLEESSIAIAGQDRSLDEKGLRPGSFGEKNFYSVSTGQLITALSSVKCDPRWSFKGKNHPRPSKEIRPECTAYSPTNDTFSTPAPRLDGSLIREPVAATITPAPNCYPEMPTVGRKGVVYAASPQYSFYGGSDGPKMRKWKGPGPGTYPNAGSTLGKSGCSFGKADRFAYEKRRGKKRARSMPCWPSLGEESPGPGSASVPQDFDPAAAWQDKGLNPPWGVRTGDRPDLTPKTNVPGPGAYDVPDKAVEDRQVTIKMKVNRAPRPLRPGPSDYDQETTMGKGPSFTVRARTKFGEMYPPPVEGPSPGQYNIEPGEKWIHAKSQDTIFGYSTRSRPQDMTGSGICDPSYPPAPNHYGAPTHPNDSCIKSPALPTSKRSGIPMVADSGLAPSHYDQVSVWDGPSITMMPRRPDPRPDDPTLPGAADYVATKYTWKTPPAWGSPSRTSKRGAQEKVDKKPGPGTYKVFSTLGGTSCSFHKKLNLPPQDEMHVLGPESQMFTNFGYERN